MQEIKRNKHLLILGLAGTGKSFEINKIISNKVENNEIQTNQVLAFTFDKALSIKYKNDFSWSNKNNTYTIHAFCYHVLFELRELPDKFISKVDSEIIKKELKEKDYDKLITLFLRLSNNRIKRTSIYKYYISILKLITCDEVQDFRSDYIDVVKKVKDLSNEAQLIIAGDSHQQIYNFQNKHSDYLLSDILNEPKLIFDNEEYETRILTVNHRTKNPYLDYFMNGFLIKNDNTTEEELYTNLPDSFNNNEVKESRKMPLIKQFTNREEELKYVDQEINKINKDKNTVAIISRNKNTLLSYISYRNNNIRVETIHKVKGQEFNYIFFVGFNYNPESDPEIKTICYTAISRAKKKLIITSSFPNKNIFEVFEKGCFIYRNVQRKICKSFLIRKKIKQNKEITINKMKGTCLDSLGFKVKAERCPFLPYIKKEKTKQKKWASSKRVINKDGFEYSIDFHHSHQIYYFHFWDLDILKRNNFSDSQKVDYCINIVINFFDERVNLEDIILYRLDLFNLLQLIDEESYYRISKLLFDKCINSKHKSILTQDKKSYKTNNDFNIIRFSKGSETIYINHHKNEYENLTTAIYNPKYKENENKIQIDNLIKFEMRGKGKFLSRGIGFKGKEPNARNLHNLCKEEEGFESLLKSWSEYYYDGGLDEFDSSLIENQ